MRCILRAYGSGKSSLWMGAGVMLVLLTRSLPVSASLGGDVSSVQTDQVRIQGAVMKVTRNGTFTVHEMRAATGTIIREYVSASGVVFGVAWEGPTVPDLRQVLGVYFAPYLQAAQAAQQKRTGHGPFRIETPAFVVEQSGHPRAFAGRAYVLQLMPASTGAELIR
jgi:hypothetical protein